MVNNAHGIERIRGAVEFVENNLSDRLSLDSIAGATHCSKYHFHRLFSQTLGMTPHSYILRRRLTEAAKSLVRTRQPLLHIALAAGYESQQAFTDAFRTMYKKPPNRFRNEAVYYPLQLPVRLHGDFSMLLRHGRGRAATVSTAARSDIPVWMDLARLTVAAFPYLDEDAHIAALIRSIDANQALIMKDGDIAIGIATSTPDAGSIDFFAIHPLYRRFGTGDALLQEVLKMMPADLPQISITAFRAGDKADIGYRDEVIGLGFSARELLTEYNYPTQRFILHLHEKRKRKR